MLVQVVAISHLNSIDLGAVGIVTFQLLAVDNATTSRNAESVMVLAKCPEGLFGVVVCRRWSLLPYSLILMDQSPKEAVRMLSCH